jgi:CRISPR system Cascade subunit CasA
MSASIPPQASRYNLIDEAWIPVRWLSGERAELGIRDTLLRAKEIAVIEDASPLVVAALHRFLLAVLYRALEGPTDIDQAKAWFKSGLPLEKIDTYLKHWRERFWLFDEKYPFGQNPNVPAKEIEPWTKLTAEHNATTNKVLFDHVDTKAPGVRTFAECACWLVSTMSFSLSGGRGYFPSPSVNGLMCIPVGRTLHDTLCYCLVDQNREVIKGDIPLWEREPENLPISSPKRPTRGNADLYTWPARMILLNELPSGGVTYIRFISGLGLEPTATFSDPMLAYINDNERGRLAVRFREDRGVWRDFDSLLPGSGGEAPLTIQHSIRLAGRDSQLLPKSMLTLGLRYTPPNANVDFWRMEKFIFPAALVEVREIREDIRQLLTIAEHAQKSLFQACCAFARDLLSHGERDPDKKDVGKFVGQMPATPLYWSRLEPAFHDILQHYTLERDPDDIRLDWLRTVRAALRDAWMQHASSVSTGDAWAIRALVRAEGVIGKQLKDLNEEIHKYEAHRNPQEETA